MSQQNLLAAGIWPAVVLNATYGETDKHAMNVQINIRFTDGPNKDRLATYEDEVNNKSAPYVVRSLKSIGWKGPKLDTLADDVQKFIAATGGATTAEVKHIPIRNGKRAGEIWDKVNSIGRGPRVLKKPSSGTIAEVESVLASALAADSGDDDANDDRIPF